MLTITLNRPDVLNAFDDAMHDGLRAALGEAGDAPFRAVVVTGAGRAFCVGQDVSALTDSAAVGELLRRRYHPNMLALRALRKPVVAAVNGAAAGAGLSLAAACDVRICARSAVFVPAFVSIGLVPDSGATHFLTRILGPARALEWMASGRRLSADEALSWGLVSELARAGGPGRARGRAGRRARGPADGSDRPAQAAVRPCAGEHARRSARAGGVATGGGGRDGRLRRGRRRVPGERAPRFRGA